MAPSELRMEPMLIRSDNPAMDELNDLAWELGQTSQAISSPRLEPVRYAMARLVRSMNCYYSNLIEGHNTQPIEIDRALANNMNANPEQRDLQAEAKAHIEVQRWLDEDDGLDNIGFGIEGVREIHQRFYQAMPPHMHVVVHPETDARFPIRPGQYRQTDVQVGRHVPVEASDIGRCMERWESVYTSLSPRNLPVATAAAHHRLAWIHPFLDGNGRVARLITHAMLKKAMGGVELWSVSRGFARDSDLYKRLLADCDHPRRGDLDGRGQLSESSLVNFTRYFLETALDQVGFMRRTLRTENFTRSMLEWVRSQSALARGDQLIEQVILYGSVERGAVPDILGMPERSARRVVKALTEHYLLVSDSHKSPLQLNIPLHAAQAVFPEMVPGNAV